ncbi:MAG: PhoH family protein, partial [Candidatus Buchananbacteria bacterium]
MSRIYVVGPDLLMDNEPVEVLGDFDERDILVSDAVIEYLNFSVRTSRDQVIRYDAEQALRAIGQVMNGQYKNGVPKPSIPGKEQAKGMIYFQKGQVHIRDGNFNAAIIKCAEAWKSSNRKNNQEVIIVSNNPGLLTAAKFSNSVSAEPYQNDSIVLDIKDLYTGYGIIPVPDEAALSVFSDLPQYKWLSLDKVKKTLSTDDVEGLIYNQCIEFVTGEGEQQKRIYAIFKERDSGELGFRYVDTHRIEQSRKNFMNSNSDLIEPVNVRQAFVQELLNDPDIWVVNLIGEAGTGKSAITINAAYEQVVLKALYPEMIFFRPLVDEMEQKDLGALPGSLQDKMGPYARPIIKNLKQVIRSRNQPHPSTPWYGKSQSKKNKKNSKQSAPAPRSIEEYLSPEDQEIEQLFLSGKLNVLSLNFERGVTENGFICFDDAQLF